MPHRSTFATYQSFGSPPESWFSSTSLSTVDSSFPFSNLLNLCLLSTEVPGIAKHLYHLPSPPHLSLEKFSSSFKLKLQLETHENFSL